MGHEWSHVVSIRILRVQFRDPVHIGNGSKASVSTKDDHIAIRQVAGGVNLSTEDRPNLVVYAPDSNIVCIAFESDAEKGKK